VGDGRHEQATVAADLDQTASSGRWRVEGQPVAARVGGVEEPQSVFQPVDLVNRPWGPVDQDDVAEHAVGVGVGDTGELQQPVVWVEEGAVRGERPVSDH
jgi:hypothetical protein